MALFGELPLLVQVLFSIQPATTILGRLTISFDNAVGSQTLVAVEFLHHGDERITHERFPRDDAAKRYEGGWGRSQTNSIICPANTKSRAEHRRGI
jgi:hypothetical protein